MRCTQMIGMCSSAKEYLDKHAKRVNCCKECGRDDGFVVEQIGSIGMFNEVPLNRYYLKDGSWANEFEQHCLWSSGPMIWLGLRLKDGTEFKWNEIENGTEERME